jgi:hypothetical protein
MASEHRTKVDLLIAQADPAAFSHGDRLIVEGVTDLHIFDLMGYRAAPVFSSPRLDGGYYKITCFSI